MTIVAQDPSILDQEGHILTAQVPVPIEDLAPGPCGYRVHVIDYDSTTQTLYRPPKVDASTDRYSEAPNDLLLSDPGFHAQNVYAIVMRTLAAFEFALGRRMSWAFDRSEEHT